MCFYILFITFVEEGWITVFHALFCKASPPTPKVTKMNQSFGFFVIFWSKFLQNLTQNAKWWHIWLMHTVGRGWGLKCVTWDIRGNAHGICNEKQIFFVISKKSDLKCICHQYKFWAQIQHWLHSVCGHGALGGELSRAGLCGGSGQRQTAGDCHRQGRQVGHQLATPTVFHDAQKYVNCNLW